MPLPALFLHLLLLSPIPGLPRTAKVIEVLALPADAYPDRSIVLWMESPKPSECYEIDPDDPEPEPFARSIASATTGCHFSGPTRVSLVDTLKRRLMNTVHVEDPWSDEDRFEIPYLLDREEEGPYFLPGEERFGKPELLRLRDVNGDGEALEIAFFDAETGSDLETTVIGYSPRRDQLVNYPIRIRDQETGETFETTWTEALADVSPDRPGYWKYTISHPPGIAEDYEIKYRRDLEIFEGTVAHRELELPQP
jgi:hypothetical protein